MANIQDIAISKAKWARRSAQSGPEYLDGINNPRRDWAIATAAAETAYEQGVQQSITQKRWGKAIKAAGTVRWQENARAKGPGRYIEGVGLALDTWAKGFQPFQEVLAALVLPPRGPKGSPQNLQRVAAVANALRKKFETLNP